MNAIRAEDVARAAAALEGKIVRTPLVAAPRLSEALGATIFLKLESLQYTGSFKDRGAGNKLQLLRAATAPPRGVVAASAGNHAQGVAWHARRLGLPATIVMPRRTPFSKIERTEALGAKVVLHGDALAEAAEAAQQLAASGLAFLHPYDDADVIAGQGTVAREMLEDRPDLQDLVVPIGGGGLIAGMATWAKSVNPAIRITGVQAEACPSMVAAVRGGPAPHPAALTLADGIAVKQPGALTTPIVRALVDELAVVGEEAIENAVQTLAAQAKVVAEGAGAAAFAAVQADPSRYAGRRVGIVVSGGNIDRRMLSTVLLRALKRDGSIARVRIEIPDAPGVLSEVARRIGAAGADIIEIDHQRVFSPLPPRQAELDVVMETRGRDHVEGLLRDLRAAGFPARVV